MWGVIRDLVGSGVTVFLTTQHLEEADQLADRIAVIDGGRLVAEGTPSQLKERVAGQRLDLVMADASAYAAAVTFLGALALHCEPGEHRISVAIDGSAAQIRQILIDLDRPGMTVETLSLHGTSLEDVFLSLTGHRSISGTAARGATVPADRDKEIVHV